MNRLAPLILLFALTLTSTASAQYGGSPVAAPQLVPELIGGVPDTTPITRTQVIQNGMESELVQFTFLMTSEDYYCGAAMIYEWKHPADAEWYPLTIEYISGPPYVTGQPVVITKTFATAAYDSIIWYRATLQNNSDQQTSAQLRGVASPW